MLTIVYNRQEFEYDTYACVTSFFPGIALRQYFDDVEHKDGNLPEEEKEAPDTLRIELYPEEGFGMASFIAGEILSKTETYTLDLRASFKEEQKAEEKAIAFKKVWKRYFYDLMSKDTGISLPWGSLTGIRPTKLIMTMLREEETEDKVRDRLYDEYRVSEEKMDLGIRIARLEDSILDPFRYKTAADKTTTEGGYSLYIGIPFCPSTCLYCSFTSFPIAVWQKKVADYLAALKREMEAAVRIMKGKGPDTIYIGGGTPTSLSADELQILLDNVREIIPMDGVKEFTVEAGRPDSITKDKLKVMKQMGVGRISVNPQTMKEETLRLIGRHHSVDDVRRAFSEAREAGFDNINMDTILGLPGETLDDVKKTFEEIEKMAPDSLTVHSLALKRASRMKRWVEEHGAIRGMDYESAMGYAAKAAGALGMRPYYLYRQKNMAGNLENTGYATEGKYGLYNILIMEEVQSIVALGVGTVSKRVWPSGRIERCENVKDVTMYLDKIDEMIARKEALFTIN